MHLINKKQHKLLYFLMLTFICSSQLWAQGNAKIIRTLVYHVIKEFQEGEGDIFKLKMNADGTKVIFADWATKVYTMNTDGTNLVNIYNFQ